MAWIELDQVSLSLGAGKLDSKTTGVLRKLEHGAKPTNVAGRFRRGSGEKAFVDALKNVTMNVRDGDRLGIIGSNGAGKTTLLKLLAGIYQPTSGTVRTKGRIGAMYNLGLGMQADATGLRNIYLSGYIAGMRRREIDASLEDIIEFTELGDYLAMPMNTYSAGMAMRLKFACATAFAPDILLFDEWIGAGDADFQAKAEARLDKIMQNAGIVVLASHNEVLMKKVANKGIWLERGEVQMIGPILDVMEARGRFRRAQAAGTQSEAQVQPKLAPPPQQSSGTAA